MLIAKPNTGLFGTPGGNCIRASFFEAVVIWAEQIL